MSAQHFVQKNTEDEWYVNFFTELPNEFWRRVASPEMTQADVAFIETHLNLHPGARILDVPCGSGRHAFALASRGYRVVGYDLSAEAISYAQSQAAQVELPVMFSQADMRNLPREGEYDAVICLGNSFGYLDLVDTRRFLSSVSQMLVEGGQLLVDFGATAESLLPGFSTTPQSMVTGDIQVTISRSYDVTRSRAISVYEFVRGDQVERTTAEYVVYTVQQLITLLEESGFSGVRLASGVEGEPYQLGSPRLLISAMRTG
ncbi:MAG: methyltransferase domain-containing protein [Actinomycetota bacterium]|nr:methyltransferase domain-containing protein [Actinomycetota bacterium]